MSSLEIDWYWNVGFVARQSSSISKKATCSKLCRANYWSKIWLLSHLFRSEFPRNMADCLFWVTYFYALSYCSLINFFPFSPFANLVDSPNNLNGKMLSAQPQMQVSNFELFMAILLYAGFTLMLSHLITVIEWSSLLCRYWNNRLQITSKGLILHHM